MSTGSPVDAEARAGFRRELERLTIPERFQLMFCAVPEDPDPFTDHEKKGQMETAGADLSDLQDPAGDR